MGCLQGRLDVITIDLISISFDLGVLLPVLTGLRVTRLDTLELLEGVLKD